MPARFINGFGLRAFRRPVGADEAARLLALFKTARGKLKLDFDESVRVLVEAILQSPGFLYRWELGPNAATLEGQVAKLAPYEVASRLSYFLWRTMPDQALFDAAAGSLKDAASVAAQAERLLASDKAKGSVHAFSDEWLTQYIAPQKAPCQETWCARGSLASKAC